MSCPPRLPFSGSLRQRVAYRTPAVFGFVGGWILLPVAAAAQFDLGVGSGPRPWFDLRNAFSELRLEPSLSTGITFTDNVDFEADARSDFIVFVRPRINLVASARRLNTNLNYTFSIEYSSDAGGIEIEQIGDSALQSANTFELVENIVFLDADASISREIVDNAITQPAGSETTRNENLTTVQRYRLSPLIRYRFDDFLVSESRVTAGYVDTGSEGDTTVTYGASQNFASGPRFTTYQWNWNTEYLDSQSGGGEAADIGDDDDNFTRFTTTLNGQVIVSPSFSLLGTIGFERIEEESLIDEPDGLIWDIGFSARPNRRLEVTASYGRRFEDDTASFEARYEISEQSVFQARFERTLETEETQLLNDLAFLDFDEEGNAVDTRTGLPPSSDIDLFGLQDEAFFANRFDATLTLSRERNSFIFDAFYEQREVETITEGNDTETVFGGRGQWSRELTREMSGTISLDYRFTEFGGDETGREDNLITFVTSLDRNLGQGFSGAFNYVFRRQESTLDTEDATENAITLSLTKSF